VIVTGVVTGVNCAMASTNPFPSPLTIKSVEVVITTVFSLFMDGRVNSKDAGKMLDKELEITGGEDIILALWKRKTIH
jgi:hypothetical protein